MTKTISILSILICTNLYAWVFPCDNYAQRDDVDYEYQRCINNNFDDITAQININFTTCRTHGGSDNIQYINCINRNFNQVEPHFQVSITDCDNWDWDSRRFPHRLSRDFQQCVNRNFRQVDFLIRRSK